MIPRILLLLAALAGLHEASKGFQINQAFPGEPAEITVNQLQTLGHTAPVFVHVTDLASQFWVCLTETRTKGGEEFHTKTLYVALVTASQGSRITRGLTTTV